jgi:hypothetical protein
MAERPILFGAPMVRALLDGRKTQTRRILKPQPELFPIDDLGTVCDVGVMQVHGEKHTRVTIGSSTAGVVLSQPKLFAAGDTLWVKETWRTNSRYDAMAPRNLPKDIGISFDADYDYEPNDSYRGRVRQSIFMMRHMSRITLRVTGVKVERLQDISEADAIAEGVLPLFTQHEKQTVAGLDPNKDYGWTSYLWHGHVGRTISPKQSDAWQHQYSSYRTAYGSYSSLWESINGEGAWDANPWVVAYTFEMIKPIL